MDILHFILRAGAVVALLGLVSCILWTLSHLRRIKREALANEALPRGGAKNNALVLIGAAAVTLTALLTYCVIHMK
jgi:hypothetical protein